MDTTTSSGAAMAAAQVRGVLLVLLINAVPIAGVLWFGWSATNVLVLYWVENLLIAVCTTIRLAVHRRLTRKKGYWRGGQFAVQVNGKPLKSGLVDEYATSAFLFTLVHGIFVAFIAVTLANNNEGDPTWQLSLPQVARGSLVIAAMLGIELIVDLRDIRARSFAWMKNYAQKGMARIIVLHIAIIVGMMAMAVTHSPFGVLFVLIGLKTAVELVGVMHRNAVVFDLQSAATASKSADPGASDKSGVTRLADKAQRDAEANQRQAIEDEETMPAPRR